MADRIAIVIAQVFGVDASKIGDDDSPDSIEAWTSMGHVNLIVAIEQEFEVSLSPEDAEEMLSVRLIRSILAEKGVRP